MRKLFGLILLAIVLLPGSALAYSSNVCKGATCDASNVGVFMQDISSACGNTGDCTLDDIMEVFNNVGIYILSIVGSIVLFMYVVGGLFLLLGGAGADNVKKGKQFIKTSTIGLLIVLVAWTAIYTLESAFTKGEIYGQSGQIEGVVANCTDQTIGMPCGTGQYQTCTADNICANLCEQQYPFNPETQVDYVLGTLEYYDCVYTKSIMISDTPNSTRWYEGCVKNLCSGGKDVQCCLVHTPF